MSTGTMKAVVFHGPGKVSVEDRPIPKLQEDGDIIVKVDKVRCYASRKEPTNFLQTALCGRSVLPNNASR